MPSPLRLLVPVLVALAMLAAPVTTWAAAGIQGIERCCCPKPEACECHDHKGASHETPKLKRCGNADIKVVAPVLVAAVAPAPAPVLIAPAAVAAPVAAAPILSDALPPEPETPPF